MLTAHDLLRARLGLAGNKAYAYLRIPRSAMTGGDARKRINAMKQYTALGSGFRSVAGTYDATTRKLTVPAPGGDTGFLRLRADGKVQLENVAVEGDRISATVK